jgi:hypothetical protein
LFQKHGLSQEDSGKPINFNKAEMPTDKTEEDRWEDPKSKSTSVFDGPTKMSCGATF